MVAVSQYSCAEEIAPRLRLFVEVDAASAGLMDRRAATVDPIGSCRYTLAALPAYWGIQMSNFPEDIFKEPEKVDPDTLANLGPLRRLAGIWEGRKGVDLNPKADGPERREYLERIEMQPIDPQTNGPQVFYGLRYHVHIVADGEDITFHDQTGYWLWEPATGLVMQTLAIPRGQTALVHGNAAADGDSLHVQAERGNANYRICSTDFLEWAFRTDAYTFDVTFNPDGSWSYVSDTLLQVRGRTEPFHHFDRNTLTKVAEPTLNPLQAIVRRGITRAEAHGYK